MKAKKLRKPPAKNPDREFSDWLEALICDLLDMQAALEFVERFPAAEKMAAARDELIKILDGEEK